jgi:1,2-phenylacetyl-CoA epoxidase catalytic subunit
VGVALEVKQEQLDDLLCVADTKWVLAHWLIKVLPNARRLDDFTALTALVQEELGHVRAIFSVVENLLQLPGQTLELSRGREELHSMELLDCPPGSWASFLLKAYVADEAALELLECLSSQGLDPIAGLTKRIANEENFHRLYWSGSLESLSPPERAEVQGMLAGVVSGALWWLRSDLHGEGRADGKGADRECYLGFTSRVSSVCRSVGIEMSTEPALMEGAGDGAWDSKRRRLSRSYFPQALYELMVPTNEMAVLARRPRRAQNKDQLMPTQSKSG